MTDELSSERLQRNLLIMTTEHSTLQGTRGTTVSEANSRVSSYLVSVSSTLVALAFIGQISRLGSAFFVFGLVLFPSVFLLGLFTFERVLQSGLEDLMCIREIQRIRHYYLEQAPELADYFLMSTHDDAAGMAHDMGVVPSRIWKYFQSFLSTSGMVAVVNSILAGVFVGLAIAFLIGPPRVVSVLAGILAFGLSAFAHQSYQTARWFAVDRRLVVRFPSLDEDQDMAAVTVTPD
ncbi:MAG TPA: hypothetical protein VF221_13980 [Chloroflexota bacterium]